MSFDKRLLRLEKQTRQPAAVRSFGVQDVTTLRQWLRREGVTPEEALALGMTGPPGLHPFLTIAKLVEARERNRQWRCERFGSEAKSDEAEASTSEA